MRQQKSVKIDLEWVRTPAEGLSFHTSQKSLDVILKPLQQSWIFAFWSSLNMMLFFKDNYQICRNIIKKLKKIAEVWFQLKFVVCLENITLIWNEGWRANGMDVKLVADDNEVLNLKDVENLFIRSSRILKTAQCNNVAPSSSLEAELWL